MWTAALLTVMIVYQSIQFHICPQNCTAQLLIVMIQRSPQDIAFVTLLMAVTRMRQIDGHTLSDRCNCTQNSNYCYCFNQFTTK